MTEKDHHQATSSWDRAVVKFETVVVALLTFLLIYSIAVTIAVILFLFARKSVTAIINVHNIAELQQSALGAFSGILLVLLGLELLETIKTYFREHRVRAEVILLVGLIALGRHVLEIDLHHAESSILYGLSALVLSLAASYFLVKRAQIPARENPP